MSNQRLKAYQVEEGADGEHVIVFAPSGVVARRDGGNELGLEFSEVSSCRRAPWADEYVGSPYIPAKAYHDAGWWLSCACCGAQLYQGEMVVYDGPRAFCSHQEKRRHDAEVSMQNAKFDAFEMRLRSGRPDLEFTELRGKYPYITMTAVFKFYGCKHGGSVRDHGDGELHWYVANGDVEAWNEYERARKEQP